jgi:hypothetical protein
MEMTQSCRSVRESLISFLDGQLEVSAFDDYCLVTLPIKTVDDRYLDIFVEPKIGDFYIVHDGGKAAAELYAQGLHITDARLGLLKTLASRFGAVFDAGTFTMGCRTETLEQAVFAISQCASLAMLDILSHGPVIEEEPVLSRVRRTLDSWRPSIVELRSRVPVKGNIPDVTHVFDFVAFSKESHRKNVAVKVLRPTYGSQIQAQRYGFMALDLKDTLADKWPRLAVVAKADQWGESALQIVRRFSARTLEISNSSVGSARWEQ